MNNPFLAVLKAQRLSKRGRPLSAALALQQIFMPAPEPKPKPKPAAVTPKPVKAARTRAATAPARPARPAPGTFINGRYQSGHGTIAYKLYTPSGSVQRRMPLVVMLHGCTQSAADFAAGTGMNALADELGFLVLYPEQSASGNLNRCWNWHQPSNQGRGGGEPAAIAELTLHAIAACRANPMRVYIAGISAGGTAAAIIGAAYPDIYAAVGVHSGVASGNVSTLSGALSAMRGGGIASPAARNARPRPTIIFHGDQDKLVHPGNARGFRDVLAGSKTGPLVGQVRQGTSAGGREFTRTLYRTSGEVLFEDWSLHGGGHAWSGGKPAGSYTDPAGPDASREMIRFFLARRRVSGGSKVSLPRPAAGGVG